MFRLDSLLPRAMTRVGLLFTILHVAACSGCADGQPAVRGQEAKAELTKTIAERIGQRYPSAHVKIPNALELLVCDDTGCFLFSLDAIWKAVGETGSSDVLDKAYRDFLGRHSAATEALANDFRLDLYSKVIPVLQGRNFINVAKEIQNGPFIEPLCDGISITYGVRNGELFRLAKQYELPAGPEEVTELAIQNFVASLEKLEPVNDGPAFLLPADAENDSCILLHHTYWQNAAKEVPGELAVIVPLRDLLVFSGTESKLGMEILHESIQMHLMFDTHVVSEDILVWTGDGWEPY